jgi:hypothetical protein
MARDLTRWVDRVGAALVAPRRALAASDSPEGRGRASSDITALLFLALLAVETHLFVKAGWLLYDGQWGGALVELLNGMQKCLLVAVIVLLAGSALLSLLGGRRRSIADDFDLVCVCLTPLVVVELVNALFVLAGVLAAHQVLVVIGYGWFAILWILSLQQIRRREQPS